MATDHFFRAVKYQPDAKGTMKEKVYYLRVKIENMRGRRRAIYNES